MLKNIYETAESTIEDYYKKIGIKPQFPIDILGIVKSIGIDVIETNLNIDIGFNLYRKNGSLRCSRNGKYEIYLEISDSDNTKRYVLAHEFSRFLLTDGKKGNYNDPFFTANENEIELDIMATCLLFPYELVLEKMLSYTEEMKTRNQYPINPTHWINELAATARVSSYHTIVNYNYIKNVICELYNNGNPIVTDKKYAHLIKG